MMRAIRIQLNGAFIFPPKIVPFTEGVKMLLCNDDKREPFTLSIFE